MFDGRCLLFVVRWLCVVVGYVLSLCVVRCVLFDVGCVLLVVVMLCVMCCVLFVALCLLLVVRRVLFVFC